VILNNGNSTFQSRSDYPAGLTPSSVATADFNGDGALDLAVTSSNCPNFPTCGAGTISILLGNGDGTFQGPNQFSTGTDTDPQSVVVGDFNGDKIPDLAVANYATNTVSILLGVGDGTFGSAVAFAVGSQPIFVATGDFNGDGKLDLVAANFQSNTVSVLLGNGDGTFQAAVSYSVGNGPLSVAVGDFNRDQKLDLVVVNETDNTVSVLLGNGDGTFQKQVVYSTGAGGNPLSVVVGDLNGDGNPDLAVADNQTQQVSVLLGNGDGTFQPSKTYATGANPSSIVAADFNGDGKLDVALISSTSVGSSPGNLVSLLLGNGDGTFGSPTLFGAGSQAISAAVGDFNGNGTPDLAVANGISDSVSILLNAQGTVMNVVSSGNPSAFGQPVTLTTTVAASLTNPTAPTGTVTLKNGSTVIGSGALVSGQVALTTPSLPVGVDSLSAVYSGDSNYQSSTLGLTQTVLQAGTSTALGSSANPSYTNQPITFSAQVTSFTTAVPAGTVTFLDGTTTIGSSSLNASGVATFTASTLSVGTHNISAAYGGNGNFIVSASPIVSQVVAGPDFSLSATALSPSSVAPGASAKSTITISPTGGLNPSAVTLTCSVSPALNPATTCSLGAISVTNDTGTSTLVVATTGSQAALASPAGEKGSGMLFAIGLIVPAILLGGAGVNKPNRRKLLSFCLIFLMLGGCLLQVACGGGGGSSTPAPAGNTGTPANTYTVTITASASGTAQHTTSVSLTVQ
jgi:hypothetical protein